MLLLYGSILLASLFLYLYFDTKYKRGYWKRLGVPSLTEGVMGSHVLSEFFSPSNNKNIGDIMRRHAKAFEGEPYYGMYDSNRPALMINDAKLAEHILIKDFDKFVQRLRPDTPFLKSATFTARTDKMWRSLLFFQLPDEWRPARKILSPVFTSGKLKKMSKLIMDVVQESEEKITEHIDSGKGSMSVQSIAQPFTINTNAATMFGLDKATYEKHGDNFRNSISALVNPTFFDALKVLFSDFGLRALYDWQEKPLFSPKAMGYLDNLMQSIIHQRRQNPGQRSDFVDLLLESTLNMPDKDSEDFFIITQCIQFFGAGYETTANTLIFILYELAMNQDVLKRLQSEIDKVYENATGDESTIPSYNDVQDLEYLEMVMAETLRKHPVVTTLMRIAVDDFKLPGTDLTIPKGMEVTLNPFSVHFDKKIYPNPEKFDPENFSEERKKGRPSCAYLPWGNGPRNCIGRRFAEVVMKSLIFVLARKFNFKMAEGENEWNKKKDMDLKPQVFLYEAKHPIMLKFEHR